MMPSGTSSPGRLVSAPRLLIHVVGTDEASVAAGLQVVRNAHHGFAASCTVALVVQGQAVQFLTAAAGLRNDIETTLGLPGVSVVACGNSLRSAGLGVNDLGVGVSSTPAAVVFLAQAQFDGWAYVRL